MPTRNSSSKSLRSDIKGFDTIPPERGTSKLKQGYVRVYHQTSPENIESIRRTGLLVEKSRPSSESRGVSVADTPFYGNNPNLVTIELQIPAGIRAQSQGLALQQDIPAGDILAIHEPWHEKVRYIQKNPVTLKEVINGDLDYLVSDEEYGRAIKYIKEQNA